MFGRSRWTEHQERRVSARHGSGDALAQALPQLFGTLLTGVLANAVAIAVAHHGGLTPRALGALRDVGSRTWEHSPVQSR